MAESKPKRFIYFPSLSAGGSADAFKKNKDVQPGLTSRFYAEEFPEEWRHPYFLVTAGHYYKKPETRKDFGLEKAFVFGDSGGYQLARGALKWSPEIRETIFHWLEHNADIAANLDIPPRTTYANRFEDSLEISLENFKWFEKHQSGKCTFLNVLQGSNTHQYSHWYDQVKDFDFGGWCVGGPQKLVDFFYALAVMLKNREFEKKRNGYIHLLGISKISDFYLLSTLQNNFNRHFDSRIQVSTDSSSPGQYPVYGTYLHSPQLSKMTFSHLYFPKGDNLPYRADDKVPNPFGHPIDMTFGEVAKYDGECTLKMVLNNVFAFNKTIDMVNELCDAHLELLETIVPSDFYQILKSMNEMFEDPDAAMFIYEKYRHYYMNYGGTHVTSTNENTFNKFFETV